MGIMIKKPEHVAGSSAPAIMIGLFVAFGGILFGYVPKLKPDLSTTSSLGTRP